MPILFWSSRAHRELNAALAHIAMGQRPRFKRQIVERGVVRIISLHHTAQEWPTEL